MTSFNNTDTGAQPNNISNIRRYELKYTIDEGLAAEIRDYVRNICTLDKYVPTGEKGYIVNNLYFDTADLRFYYDTKFRKITRYKPRARYYRNASIIWKHRYSLPIAHWSALFSPVETGHKPSSIKKHLDTFDEVVYWHGAEPVLHVRYHREPYVTELEAYGRVTFDRWLCCRPTKGSIELEYDEKDMLYYDDPITSKGEDSPVILELKLETLIPEWAIDLIHRFNLMQRAYSKYCYGIDCLRNYVGEGRIANFG